jgi:hypothetical protein
MARTGLAALAVFVTWSILGFLLHGMILTSTYAATPQLWRPMAEYKMTLGTIVTIISAICFVIVYAQWITDKRLQTALLYGLVFGIGRGIAMGYGSYAAMPMPYMLALAWFLGAVVDGLAGGLVLGLIVRGDARPGKA